MFHFHHYGARMALRSHRTAGIFLSDPASLGFNTYSLHIGTAASRGCCSLTEFAVTLAQLSCSCWACALGLCESLGMSIWFPSLVPTPQTLARLLCHQGLCLVTGNWGKFNCFLLSFSHAAEQKVHPQFSPCPWEAVYPDWVSVQDVYFIFLHYKSFWNLILLATRLCL